jgi:hypothetical protein
MSALNETLIRDVVAEVLGRLNGAAPTATAAPAPVAKQDCGCGGKGASSSVPALRGKFGVFQDANEALPRRTNHSSNFRSWRCRAREDPSKSSRR